MLEFKKFDNAIIAISGIELTHKIRKGQFDTSELGLEKVRRRLAGQHALREMIHLGGELDEDRWDIIKTVIKDKVREVI